MDATHLRRLSEFMEGEPRMVWARDRSKGSTVVRFPDNEFSSQEKRDYHRYTVENLVCVVDECGAQLNAHFRKNKINGYAHARGTGREHAPERVWHQMGKQLVTDWAQTKGAIAQMEEPSLDLTRRPDITITMPSGAQIAVEVQYSPMTHDEYYDRHADHAKQYATTVWLLGQGGDNFRYTYKGIRLNRFAQSIRDCGDTLLWLNATMGTILTAWNGKDSLGPLPTTGSIATDSEEVPIAWCCWTKGAVF